MDQKFYLSEKNVLALITGSTTELKELNAGTTDAAKEKHVPVWEVKDGKVYVKVGDIAHPMTPEHLIEWAAVKTDKGLYFRFLKAGDPPAAVFTLVDESVEEVYAYCNLHGLWKA
ncbi:superoxide reductase [Ruminococcaceae bacterium FB2012]|nr:superoxide reductase [Ruminococcaceae bacterium FB2012]